MLNSGTGISLSSFSKRFTRNKESVFLVIIGKTPSWYLLPYGYTLLDYEGQGIYYSVLISKTYREDQIPVTLRWGSLQSLVLKNAKHRVYTVIKKNNGEWKFILHAKEKNKNITKQTLSAQNYNLKCCKNGNLREKFES